MKNLRCPDCGRQMVIKKTEKGFFYVCTRAGCKGKHMANSVGRPVGKPVNSYGRYLRAVCHKGLEEIWNPADLLQKKEMYDWVATIVPVAHMGKMGIGELKVLKAALDDLKENPWKISIIKIKSELEDFLFTQITGLKLFIEQSFPPREKKKKKVVRWRPAKGYHMVRSNGRKYGRIL